MELLQDWGIYIVTGIIFLYFAWGIYKFIDDHRESISFSQNPLTVVTAIIYALWWAFGNGIGNALFQYAVAGFIKNVVLFYFGSFDIPQVAGLEVLAFLLGLVPSLDQFRYQSDPAYLVSLNWFQKMVALAVTVADGVVCMFGYYFWLLPPTFRDGQLYVVWNQGFLIGTLVWSILVCYVAQYIAHMRFYEVLGLQPPDLPNPFMALWDATIGQLLPSQDNDGEEEPSQVSRRRKRARQQGQRTSQPRSSIPVSTPVAAVQQGSVGSRNVQQMLGDDVEELQIGEDLFDNEADDEYYPTGTAKTIEGLLS